MAPKARKTTGSQRHLWWFTLSGDGSSNWGSNWSSQHLTVARASGKSKWPVWPGRGVRMKVNLLTSKDEKTKDVVTYLLWWWDIAIFCCSGWDNQHLLPYVIWSLQGFPGALARSQGENVTLNDVLQTMDEHYGVVWLGVKVRMLP